MSKIRQAVRYESGLAASKAKAQRVLVQSEQAAIRGAIEYERRLTEQQFNEVRTLQAEHQRFHDREHILYDDAVEKASAALRGELEVLEADLERLRELAHGFMTTGRFEREHQALIDRMNEAIEHITSRLEDEAKVTIKQETQAAVLERIAANNRWLVGIALTSGISLFALIAHILGVY